MRGEHMRPTTKMLWLFIIIILGAALFFVILDDEDTQGNADASPSAALHC